MPFLFGKSETQTEFYTRWDVLSVRVKDITVRNQKHNHRALRSVTLGRSTLLHLIQHLLRGFQCGVLSDRSGYHQAVLMSSPSSHNVSSCDISELLAVASHSHGSGQTSSFQALLLFCPNMSLSF